MRYERLDNSALRLLRFRVVSAKRVIASIPPPVSEASKVTSIFFFFFLFLSARGYPSTRHHHNPNLAYLHPEYTTLPPNLQPIPPLLLHGNSHALTNQRSQGPPPLGSSLLFFPLSYLNQHSTLNSTQPTRSDGSKQQREGVEQSTT